MPYRLKHDESIEPGIQRICHEQIDRAIDEIEDDDLDRHETVHQVRKRCKKLRGALRLVRGGLADSDTFSRENAWFRDSAKTLSYVRDAEALIETYNALIERFEDEIESPAFDSIRQLLEQRRKRIADDEMDIDLDERLKRFHSRMYLARERIADWTLDGDSFDEALRPGLEKTYGRARKRFAKAMSNPSDEAFHEWRKRVKYHWYHCRLLREIWPRVMRARRDEAGRLADLLGDEHDLTVLSQTLGTEKELASLDGTAALLGLAAQHRKELRRHARPLGRRLLAEKPKHLSRRLGTYWAAFKSQVTGS